MKRLTNIFLALLVFCACACSQKGEDAYVVGFYNLENLFDVYDDPAINDADFLPDGRNNWTEDKYQKKVNNMARVISEMAQENGRFHTLLGVCEVENLGVLEDLVADPQIADAGYEIAHYDSPDRRGIDVALLYRPELFTYIESESIPYTFEGSSIDFIMSPEEQADFRTRDVLMVHGKIEDEHFAVYVAHLPSRSGDKPGSNQLRDRGAEIMYDHAMMMMEKYPGIKIICMGDMNDNPTDPSMAEYLHGKETVAEVAEADFFSPFLKMLKDGYGTLSYRGVWNIYDLILVNNALVNAPEGTLRISGNNGYYGNVFNRPFLTNQDGQYKGTPFRAFSGGKFIDGYSDHYPTYIVIAKQ